MISNNPGYACILTSHIIPILKPPLPKYSTQDTRLTAVLILLFVNCLAQNITQICLNRTVCATRQGTPATALCPLHAALVRFRCIAMDDDDDDVLVPLERISLWLPLPYRVLLLFIVGG